jgi:hypothetical protein
MSVKQVHTGEHERERVIPYLSRKPEQHSCHLSPVLRGVVFQMCWCTMADPALPAQVLGCLLSCFLAVANLKMHTPGGSRRPF